MSDALFALILQFYILHGNTKIGKERTLEATAYLSEQCSTDLPDGMSLVEVKIHTIKYLKGELKCLKR